MFKIACHQGKHLTSKSGSLQTFLSCKFILYISPFPTNQCFSSPNKVPEPWVHQRALQAQRVSGPAPRGLRPVLPTARLGAMVGPGLQLPGRQQVRGSQQGPWWGLPSKLRSLLRAPRPALAMGSSDLTSFSPTWPVLTPAMSSPGPPGAFPIEVTYAMVIISRLSGVAPMEPAPQCPRAPDLHALFTAMEPFFGNPSLYGCLPGLALRRNIGHLSDMAVTLEGHLPEHPKSVSKPMNELYTTFPTTDNRVPLK